jgi:hypothetical protein
MSVREPLVRILEREVTALTTERDQLRAEVERLKRDYDYDHKCLYEVRECCELWKQRAERAEAFLRTLGKWKEGA